MVVYGTNVYTNLSSQSLRICLATAQCIYNFSSQTLKFILAEMPVSFQNGCRKFY